MSFLDPRYHALLKHGRQGEALILESKDDRVAGEASTGGWHVMLRVKFADGTVEDFKRFIAAEDTDFLVAIGPGAIVPIRFDPQKRSHMEIDVRAVRALRDARRAERLEQVSQEVEQAEARLRPLDNPGIQ
jgi:hypothetical protein